MTYNIMDDLEQVYDSFEDEPAELFSDWSETHYRVSGMLHKHVRSRLWMHDGHLAQRRDYVFLLFGLDHKTDTCQLQLGYGPGECDLTFVDIPFDSAISMETNLLYWLVGLR